MLIWKFKFEDDWDFEKKTNGGFWRNRICDLVRGANSRFNCGWRSFVYVGSKSGVEYVN